MSATHVHKLNWFIYFLDTFIANFWYRTELSLKLKVRPKVNRDGFITTKIEPEVSSVLELVGGYVPRTKVRKITTTVTVPDGQKIIIGGLLNSNIVKTVNKVPLLGSIPILGYLFQHHVTNINTTDLIIEITPRVVTFDDYNEKIQYLVQDCNKTDANGMYHALREPLSKI